MHRKKGITCRVILHIAQNNLYNNTVLDSCVILSVCSFAIETTFPLSNFKTKHIFRILMERVKLLKPFRAPQAPPERGGVGTQIFLNIIYRRRSRRKLPPQVGQFRRPKYGAPVAPQSYFLGLQKFPKLPTAPQIYIVYSFTAEEGGGLLDGRRRRRSPGGRGKSRRRPAFREYIMI